jgi:hypothetical protein
MTKERTLLERLPVPAWLPRIARTIPFRVGLVVVCLTVHLIAITTLGRTQFHRPFDAAPDEPPHFLTPTTGIARNWDRLVVSRWDTGHYTTIALRGYTLCPKNGFPDGNFAPTQFTCDLAFYPTYPWLAWAVSLGGRLPIDWTFLAISLVCSGIFLFLWTGPWFVARMGLWPTYVSFIVLNVFTTAYTLVTAQTEPLALVLTLGAFVALMGRRFLLGALLAGAASAVRITALSTGLAYGLALIAVTVQQWPLDRRALGRRALELVASGWGVLALLGYYAFRFHDPFVYLHAHAQTHGHNPSFARLFAPDIDQVAAAIDHPLHEGVWLAAALLWFGLGHREALARFSLPERVFCYALFGICVVVAAYGTADLAFQGMNRYLILCFPLFLAIAAQTARRPFVLAVWIVICVWHYWNIDLCEYTGGPGNNTLKMCHAAHWIGRI